LVVSKLVLSLHHEKQIKHTTMFKSKLQNKIIELWHISRTALSNVTSVPTRYERMTYVRDTLIKHNSDLIEGLSVKNIWFTIENTITVAPI
jgi:hypothetical protein